MNMQQLKRTRKRPVPGSIFVYKLKQLEEYGFGRVVRTDVFLDTDYFLLLYFYNAFSSTKDGIPELRADQLLIPPVITNRLGWTRGYYETVEVRPLTAQDVLPVHCFWDQLTIPDCYRDEDGCVLDQKHEPCGLYALDSFRTIDAQISMALGIAPHPDTVPPPE